MKIFVWRRIMLATESHHPEGGVVIVAEDEQTAREWFNGRGTGGYLSENEPPNIVADLAENVEPQIFVMPDAGCC